MYIYIIHTYIIYMYTYNPFVLCIHYTFIHIHIDLYFLCMGEKRWLRTDNVAK
jgi:hypothetical protein